MNRRLGVVAWVAATVLSVAASTAAVASVREQVTDRPDLVSLAALRRAADTDTTSPQAAALPQEIRENSSSTTVDTTATTVAVTTTTRPAVEAVPDTIVETTTTSTPTTAQPPDTTTTTRNERDGDDGFGRAGHDDDAVQESRDFQGGSVSVEWDGYQLRLVEVAPDEGYEYEIEKKSDRELVVRFSKERRRSTTVVATLDRGRVEIRVFD